MQHLWVAPGNTDQKPYGTVKDHPEVDSERKTKTKKVRWPGVVAHTFNPSTGKQRQEDFCEFKASLIYLMNSRTVKTTQRNLVSNKQTYLKTLKEVNR